MTQRVLTVSGLAGRAGDGRAASGRESAACLGTDTELFFPVGFTGPAAAGIQGRQDFLRAVPGARLLPEGCPGHQPDGRDMGRLRRKRAHGHTSAAAPLGKQAKCYRRVPAVTVTCVRHFTDGTRLTVTLLEDQAGLRLRGETDMLSAGALRAAIAALPADAREVHFELAELTFIDVGGTRELASGPGPPPAAAMPDPASAAAQPDPSYPPAVAGLSPGPGAVWQQDRKSPYRQHPGGLMDSQQAVGLRTLRKANLRHAARPPDRVPEAARCEQVMNADQDPGVEVLEDPLTTALLSWHYAPLPEPGSTGEQAELSISAVRGGASLVVWTTNGPVRERLAEPRSGDVTLKDNYNFTKQCMPAALKQFERPVRLQPDCRIC